MLVALAICCRYLLPEKLSAENAAARELPPESLIAEDDAGQAPPATEGDGQSPLTLSIKNINLSQGEGGSELWRLKAEQAGMLQENGGIIVQRPSLTYFMPEKDAVLLVTSDRGIIDQKEQILSFIDKVHIIQNNKSIFSNLLIYNGTIKTMTFPHGGNFSDTGVSGSASFLVWDIPYKVIRAEGDISVNFFASEPSPALTPEQE
jgi:hypothetical protein